MLLCYLHTITKKQKRIDMNETIFAPATPFGEGGVSIIRISGIEAAAIADQLFVSAKSGISVADCDPYRLYRGRLHDPKKNQPYDDILLAYMKGPNSYTGEDVVELHLHGSPVIVRKTLSFLAQAGGRFAEPGEFTKRAFLNGKMDLLQAEAVQDMIQAKTRESQLAAFRILGGGLSEKVLALIEELKKVLAILYLNLDFNDDVQELPREQLLSSVQDVNSQVQELLRTYQYGKMMRNGIEIVLAGAPNVGKSSLFNTLLVEDRAIVTDVEGTTRDIIKENINIKGLPVILVDTAGLRQTDDKVEKIGVQMAQNAAHEADLTIFMIDAHRADEQIAEYKQQFDKLGKHLLVINKEDLLNTAQKKKLLAGFPEAICISALEHSGIEELNDFIFQTVTQGAICSQDVSITSLRHKLSLESAQNALRDFSLAVQSDVPEDLLLVDLQHALEFMKEMTGEIVTDQVLDKIFKEFCIGK